MSHLVYKARLRGGSTPVGAKVRAKAATSGLGLSLSRPPKAAARKGLEVLKAHRKASGTAKPVSTPKPKPKELPKRPNPGVEALLVALPNGKRTRGAVPRRRTNMIGGTGYARGRPYKIAGYAKKTGRPFARLASGKTVFLRANRLSYSRVKAAYGGKLPTGPRRTVQYYGEFGGPGTAEYMIRRKIKKLPSPPKPRGKGWTAAKRHKAAMKAAKTRKKRALWSFLGAPRAIGGVRPNRRRRVNRKRIGTTLRAKLRAAGRKGARVRWGRANPRRKYRVKQHRGYRLKRYNVKHRRGYRHNARRLAGGVMGYVRSLIDALTSKPVVGAAVGLFGGRLATNLIANYVLSRVPFLADKPRLNLGIGLAAPLALALLPPVRRLIPAGWKAGLFLGMAVNVIDALVNKILPLPDEVKRLIGAPGVTGLGYYGFGVDDPSVSGVGRYLTYGEGGGFVEAPAGMGQSALGRYVQAGAVWDQNALPGMVQNVPALPPGGGFYEGPAGIGDAVLPSGVQIDEGGYQVSGYSGPGLGQVPVTGQYGPIPVGAKHGDLPPPPPHMAPIYG